VLRERFSRPLDRAAARLSGSTEEDAALLGADLWGSLAHARMLGTSGILSKHSAERIEDGLRAIARAAARGRFALDPALEDVHLNVEHALTKRLGADGERLHTGRSRNDQVATDLALYTREALLGAEERTLAVVDALVTAARSPGGRRSVEAWTHLQPAQRVYWGGLLGAHALRFLRDAERLAAVRRGIRRSPLGSGAIAGSSLPLDRARTARWLGFEGPSLSSIDGVSDRDASLEALFAIAQVHVHASQLGEEIVIGSMPEVARIRLSEGFVTTSSLMPHKRNPDLAELVRAESAGAIGRLTAALALVRSLPIGYQRDLQAGKPALVEAFARLDATLEVLAPMIAEAELLSPPARDPATGSVELADELVRSGVPFRRAHTRVATFLAEWERLGRPEGPHGPAGLERAFPELAGRPFRWPRAEEEPDRRITAGGSHWKEVDRLLRSIETRAGRARRETAATRRRLERARAAFGLPESLFERARRDRRSARRR
jgi:argininosuccinate lyase